MDADQPLHELFKFMTQVTDEMALEYSRIRSRASEDPGTAGDEGEENWAELLREWLPPSCQVETKGRILGVNGKLSPQLDVIVLHSSYPRKLLKKKTFLASGVLAAFECKLTLKKDHIARAFEDAVALHDVVTPREGDPYSELHHSIVFGLLAHSHAWSSQEVAKNRIETSVHSAHEAVPARPCDVPDVICVADLGTWVPMKISSTGLMMLEEERKKYRPDQVEELYRAPWTEYMKPIEPEVGNDTTPIGSMFAKVLSRLAYEESTFKNLSEYFMRAGLSGAGEGFSRRVWPPSYSTEVAARLPIAVRNDGNSRWGMAFL